MGAEVPRLRSREGRRSAKGVPVTAVRLALRTIELEEMTLMIAQRRSFLALTTFAVVLGIASPARAGFADWQQIIFRGTEYAGNQLFLSAPQGGPLFNFNLFEQRLEFNRAGDGYTYEFYRFFGPDSFGNTNTLDLGPFKLELGADQAFAAGAQPVGIHNKVGYTMRFIPEVFFETQTGQRTFNQFSGISTFAPTPLSYTATFNGGFQDFQWTGNALVDTSGRLNVLGFYDYSLRFTNIGNYTADGMLVQDETVTDFDIGPIDVSGNIFMDMTAGFLQGIGSAIGAVPPRVVSGAAAKDKETEELLARLDAGEALSDEEISYLVQEMISTAIEKDPIGVMLNGIPETVEGFESLSFTLSADTEGLDEAVSAGNNLIVPEPGTLVLLAMVIGSLALAGKLPARRNG